MTAAAEKTKAEAKQAQGLDEAAVKQIVTAAVTEALAEKPALDQTAVEEIVASKLKEAAPDVVSLDEEAVGKIVDQRLAAAKPAAGAGAPPLDDAAVRRIVSEQLRVSAPIAPAGANAAAAEPVTDDATRQALAQGAERARKASDKAGEAETKARSEASAKASKVAKLDYDAAVAGKIASAGQLVQDGPAQIRFGDGRTFVASIPPVTVSEADMPIGSGRSVYSLPIVFPRDVEPATITEAWLIAGDKAVLCEIPGGLQVGNGLTAQLPANHLAF